MRTILVLTAIFLTLTSAANAFMDCPGHPQVRVWPKESMLRVDGLTYRMITERMGGRRGGRLTGNGMIFTLHQKDGVLIRNGTHSRYTCERGSGPGEMGTVVPYVANSN
jgi:hypothetical protein